MRAELMPDRRHRLVLEAEQRDGDAVHLEARVQVHRYTAEVAVEVTLDELRAFRSAVQAVHNTLGGHAVLDTAELLLRLVGDGKGHVAVDGETRTARWDTWGAASLRFELPGVDQTHLPALVAALAEAPDLPSLPDED